MHVSDQSRYLLFQDAAGKLNQLTYSIDATTSNLSLSPAVLPDCPAANGTGLSGTQVSYGEGSSAFYVYYVNQHGVLAECYQNSTTTSGTWIPGPGNLSTYEFKAPTDNRPALYVIRGVLDGISTDSAGFRLFAGGVDEGDLGSGFCEGADDFEADASCAAGYRCYFAIELELGKDGFGDVGWFCERHCVEICGEQDVKRDS